MQSPQIANGTGSIAYATRLFAAFRSLYRSSVARMTILIATIFLCLAACGQGAGTKHFTQCFKPVDQPFSRSAEFHRDEERRCYGIRWTLPRDYLSASLGDGPLAQNFMLALPATTLRSYTSAPSAERQKIEVRSLLGSFDMRVQEIRRAAAVFPGVNAVNQTFLGLEVHAKQRPSAAEQEFFLLLPPGPTPQFLVKVWTRPGQTLAQLPQEHPLEVISNVDDRVYLEYRLPRSQLPQLQATNEEIILLVRSFMID